MHEFTGLSTSFSSGSICRWCHADYHDMHQCLRACTLSLRTKEDYDEVIESEDELMMEHHGIKYSCLLNTLPGFHTTLSSPPGFFHDVLEGVARKEIHRLQQHLSRRGLTREDLNERLARHDYGRTDDANRPSALSPPTGSTIGNKANQSWLLIRYLLVVAEDYGDANSPEWNPFRLFSLLVESLTKTKYTDLEVDRLEESIEEWISSYVTLYGVEEMISGNGRFKSSITPKHHYLLHYPHHIRMVGPLIHLSTFTYESMHLTGKAKSYITKCFINLPLTISNTYALVCAERRSRPYLEVTPSKPDTVSTSSSPLLSSLSMALPPILPSCKSIDYRGTTFRIRDLIVRSMSGSIPLFSTIESIVHLNNSWHFVGYELLTSARSNITQAFLVKMTNTPAITPITSLYSPFPLALTKNVIGDSIVVLKHGID
ncbi:hypothetical protein PFISCL1PPCAC_25922 [Pristionchus fissidentatus]|uniref:Uncharacterized protein n=1 Tax=Pristionchus fissidentatus TaxID=1538716 RepID=A0AAV5WSP6_9BILA|nr:hypothetical protein PFISCL1PPCAC_25922 [Pristionchus fissidentatus]